jgi:oligopeptide/dipeptide ABC transporter ATP-binding protein
MSDMVRVQNLSRSFQTKDGPLQALDDVTFTVRQGQTLGIVGESGCGKTTLARLIVGIDQPSAGEIHLGGLSVATREREERARLSRFCQMVFQDPYASLNPRMRVGDIIAEPLVIHGVMDRKSRNEEVERLIERVGLPSDAERRYPHAFSGGQRQRIAIARALALKPRILVADEPVSALDVSIQAQILNLLAELRDELDLTLLIVSHDLQVIRWISDHVMVMYLGRVVELAPKERLFERPEHPYTRALLQAAPQIRGENDKRQPAPILGGEIPSPLNPPSGCAFHPRCPLGQPYCTRQKPALEPLESNHQVACFDVHGMPTAHEVGALQGEL